MRRRGRWVALVLLACLLGGCGSAGRAGGPAPSAPAGGAVILASDITFDRSQLDVPAGRPFALLFENREGAPHNVRIFDQFADQPLFVGEVVSGPSSKTYEVPAIPAGAHHFRCDVHPDMAGTVTAR